MLESNFTAVLATRTKDEFHNEVVRFAKQLGFDTVAATLVIDHHLGEAEFIGIDNTPHDYKDLFEDVSRFGRDPVMQHCKRNSVPIIWDQKTYAEQGARPDVGGAGSIRDTKRHCDGLAHAGRSTLRPGSRSRQAHPQGHPRRHSSRCGPPAFRGSRAGRGSADFRSCSKCSGSSFTDAAGTGNPSLDDGGKDRVGGGKCARHQRANRGLARKQRHAQAWLRQQASSGLERRCAWA